MPSEDELLAIAERAARTAGGELLSRWGKGFSAVGTKSSPTDPVSEADLAAERAIRDVLARERPEDSVLGEEGGEQPASSPSHDSLRWVVDPLDGTVNFLYGFPMFAVSVACEDDHGAVAGVVLDPVRDECFTATRTGPARLNGDPIQARRPHDLSETLVATGFAYDPDVRAAQAAVLTRVLPVARDIRRAGAAALDLCWCACGRVDAYFERGLRRWDFAAGALICTRAGLSVRRLPSHVPSDSAARLPEGLLVAPPALVDELERLVAGPPQ